MYIKSSKFQVFSEPRPPVRELTPAMRQGGCSGEGHQETLRGQRSTPGGVSVGPHTVPASCFCGTFCRELSIIGAPVQADPTIHQRPVRSAFRTPSQETRSCASVPEPAPRT